MANLFIEVVQVVLLQLFVHRCHGFNVTSGFMPGSSPAFANDALNICQKRSVAKQSRTPHAGEYGELINRWCTTYDDMLPCLSKVLPGASNANDWFLKLIYNETISTSISKKMCARFPFISNLTCVDESKANVAKCMSWNTQSAIDHYNSLFVPNGQFTKEKQANASVYACIVTVATAACFHKEMTSCPEEKRLLIYDYFILLSGKCREIAGIPETTTTEEPSTTTSGSTTLPQTKPTTISSSQSNLRATPRNNTRSNSNGSTAGGNNRKRNMAQYSGASSTLPSILTLVVLLLGIIDIQ